MSFHRPVRVIRLTHHIPRGRLLRQLGSGLLIGNLAHTLPIVALPRLQGLTAVALEPFARVQISMNNVTRFVVRGKRDNHVRVETLLETAQYLSVNQLAMKATGMAAWAAFMSNNGRDGTRKPVGRLMFNSDKIDAATGRPNRATTAGEVCVPTRGKATFVIHSLAVWNACQELRSAVTKSAANSVSRERARACSLVTSHVYVSV
jgi:hypothetical protein